MYVTIQNFGFNNAVKCFIADGEYDFPTRIHQFAEIQFILEGGVELTSDGKEEFLEAGDIIVISPFKPHSFKTKPGTKRWILIPSSNFISDFVSGNRALINGERCGFTASDGLSLFVRENLFDMGDKVVDLEANDRLTMKIKTLAYAILNEYTEKIPQITTEIKNNALASIILYIAENFRENLTRASVGAALGYSPSYISHVIEDLPETTFSSLLNSMRVEYAKKLLTEKKISNISSKEKGDKSLHALTLAAPSMLDVALECGFGSERNFYRIFKAHTGYSPKFYASKKASV
jgi:AraC-like DNA-binding protein/quercetin dioxygenase-like cupin family protein